jgi:hypothetical protein
MGLKTKASKFTVSKCLDTMRVLLEHGALWRPDDARAINDVSRNLYDCDAEVPLEVINALLKHNACVRESLDTLLKTPAIKQHIGQCSKETGVAWIRRAGRPSKKRKRLRKRKNRENGSCAH